MSILDAGLKDPNDALVLTLGGGAVAAVSITFLWMRLLRKSPKIQEVLQVTAEGVPIVAVEEESTTEAKEVEAGRSESGSVNP